MIEHTEQQLYDFLKEIMSDKGFNVYRGYVPSNSFEDRENGKKTNDYFPYVILRVTEFSQIKEGFHNYESTADFEIWIGTKEEREEDYINNLKIGDYIRQKLLEESARNREFAINELKDFRVEYFSDRMEPYYFSRITFTVYAEPILSEVYERNYRK